MTEGPAERQHEAGVVPRTRAEHLAARLEARIRTLAPGAPVGTIEELRTESGFARATVSEAVRLLADRGVLVVRPGRGGGLFAAEQGPVVRMRRTLLAAANRPTEVADAVELRNQLEELIDLGAARCCGEADAAELRSRLRAMEVAADWGGFVRATWALHERIAELCPNAMARAVYVATLGHLGTTSPQLESDDARSYRGRRLQVHVDLVDAITAGDDAAVRAAVARHHHTD
ncbi:FCD domain-containing protein [Actinomycetospora endophytica]|uniref:FCD domain-containing protein n=1 Tax=Actinomycetospora endophytica TaxID=2291215 RepID=A0ABS8PFX3_9PSEU|nr:FCD domain-containing protein [Actinomycetospora endophytica]MCD2196903.1 FCD domain-containing protein [Actinomycetospora endophytica]